jgi:hypothetical protein
VGLSVECNLDIDYNLVLYFFLLVGVDRGQGVLQRGCDPAEPVGSGYI